MENVGMCDKQFQHLYNSKIKQWLEFANNRMKNSAKMISTQVIEELKETLKLCSKELDSILEKAYSDAKDPYLTQWERRTYPKYFGIGCATVATSTAVTAWVFPPAWTLTVILYFVLGGISFFFAITCYGGYNNLCKPKIAFEKVFKGKQEIDSMITRLDLRLIEIEHGLLGDNQKKN